MQTEYLSKDVIDHNFFLPLQRGGKSSRQLLEQAKTIIRLQQKRIDELNRIATTDELTGIANKRGFIQAFERELDRAKRKLKTSPADAKGGLLIMIDLDNFKGINDMHGHAAGDAALKLIAKTLVLDTRKMDLAGRLGGDEFVVLFTNTSREDALKRVQHLVRTINNLSFIWEGKEIPVRASVGIREYQPGDKTARIFSAADKALYSDKAKNSGLKTHEASHV